MHDLWSFTLAVYLLVSLFLMVTFLGDRDMLKLIVAEIPDQWPGPASGLLVLVALAVASLIWPIQMIKMIWTKCRKYRARKNLAKMIAWSEQQSDWPYYQCHKRVRAIKIKGIVQKANPDITGQSAAESYGAYIIPEKQGDILSVDDSFMTKHKPEVGGYIVVYEDGYMSYSPAKAFEEGYTEITPGSPGPVGSSKYKAEQDRRNRHLSEAAAAIANVGDAKKSE
jgi:hypothetical protein